MIRPSFIPPLAIRELRDLTRRRRQLIGENSRERNRVQKVLEDANIKLGDVLSDVFCVSGKLMLAALLDGQMNAEQIADMAKKKAREKIPHITASVADHRLSDHQRSSSGMRFVIWSSWTRRLRRSTKRYGGAWRTQPFPKRSICSRAFQASRKSPQPVC